MRVEQIEIYSDATNRAILRHPDRKFPGLLIQGDNLHLLCQQADAACASARETMSTDNYATLNDLRNSLWAYLNHYKQVLGEHDLRLPFTG